MQRLKIAIGNPKISVRHPKISGLKISVDSLKIAGLKIIARVCVCACMYVRSHFAEVSKMAQDAPRAKEHKHRSDHHKSRSTSARAPNTKKKIKKQ